jgi:hypothetical protein
MLKQLLSNPAVLAVVGLIILAALTRLVLVLAKKSPGVGGFPYEPVGFLLSPAERSFLGVVEKVVEPDFVLFPKVRLADVISVRSGLSAPQFQSALNRITSKHVDFILCRQSDFAITAAIELDDQSHQRKDRMARDQFVDQALAAAGIPVLHVKAQSHYEPRMISDQLAALLRPKTSTAISS